MLDELCAQGKAEVDNKGRYSKVSGKRRDRRKNKEALKAEKPERGRKGRERREKDHEEYRFSEKDGTLMEGTFIGHYKGFGFVEVEDQEQDIFIPEMTREAPCIRIRCRSLYGTDIKRENVRKALC